jgi:catechol-2,3-dioxygenase
MPKYVVNKGSDSELEINAADHRESKALVWFYDTEGNGVVCLKQSFIESLEELPA